MLINKATLILIAPSLYPGSLFFIPFYFLELLALGFSYLGGLPSYDCSQRNFSPTPSAEKATKALEEFRFIFSLLWDCSWCLLSFSLYRIQQSYWIILWWHYTLVLELTSYGFLRTIQGGRVLIYAVPIVTLHRNLLRKKTKAFIFWNNPETKDSHISISLISMKFC